MAIVEIGRNIFFYIWLPMVKNNTIVIMIGNNFKLYLVFGQYISANWLNHITS